MTTGRASSTPPPHSSYEYNPDTNETIFYDEEGNEVGRGAGEYTAPETTPSGEGGEGFSGYSMNGKENANILTGFDQLFPGGKARERRAAQQRNYLGGKFVEGMEGMLGSYDNLYSPDALTLAGGRGPERAEAGQAAADASAVRSQSSALQALEHMARGGYTAEEVAAMNRMRQETAQQERSQREAIMQNMAARGQSGSGQELAAQLSAQQNAANMANTYGLETQAQAQQRALQALAQQGSLASQTRSQSYTEDQTNRSAVDDFNRWNTERMGAGAQQEFENRLNTAQARSNAAAQQVEAATQRDKQVEEERKGKTLLGRVGGLLGDIF